MGYCVKDSGKRREFASGMVRDIDEGKIDYERIFDGPMADRWAEHLTIACRKYPDLPDGTPNWMLADGTAEMRRFKKSAIRHLRQWIRGDADEDHAAAVMFNINGYEYVKGRMDSQPDMERETELSEIDEEIERVYGEGKLSETFEVVES